MHPSGSSTASCSGALTDSAAWGRTIAGLQRAKAQGRVGDRPKAEDAEPKLVPMIARLRSRGQSIRAIAAEIGTSPNTIHRLLKRGTSSASYQQLV